MHTAPASPGTKGKKLGQGSVFLPPFPSFCFPCLFCGAQQHPPTGSLPARRPHFRPNVWLPLDTAGLLPCTEQLVILQGILFHQITHFFRAQVSTVFLPSLQAPFGHWRRVSKEKCSSQTSLSLSAPIHSHRSQLG